MIFRPEEYSLHTHSFYCGHGVGEPIDYAHAAQKAGLKLIGMSEHLPLPGDRWSNSRMPYSMLEEYVSVCKSLQKMEDLPTIARGFECDFTPEYTGYYKDHILGENRAEYLICAVHYLDTAAKGKDTNIFFYNMTPADIRKYADLYISGLDSGLFAFGAHPDLYMVGYSKWDSDAAAVAEDITQCAAQLGIPLEINGNGLRRPLQSINGTDRSPYPFREFWQIALKNGATIIANADAHDPAFVVAHGTTELRFAAENGIPLRSAGYSDSRLSFV